VSRQNAAFIESYFSNYVEGTKFDIQQARDIVMNNQVVPNRPKDSHDILGVFRLAITSPYRDSPPLAGTEFLDALESWHAEMLRMRPEANPGKPKLEVNYAGTTQFVDPAMVRGTLAEGSASARSVPEGTARAIYYAFLVSEVHPFDDGNGRLSRLVMNAELTRSGLSRIIVPTLYHPQYVDCARALTRKNVPKGFVDSLAKMARWSLQPAPALALRTFLGHQRSKTPTEEKKPPEGGLKKSCEQDDVGNATGFSAGLCWRCYPSAFALCDSS
jgi:hypothetical protein